MASGLRFEMPDSISKRPKLAYPFTILKGQDVVRLVAGEDYRYTLSGPGVDGWLADWLVLLDGSKTLEQILAPLPADRQTIAIQVIERLYGERVLVDGSAIQAHAAHTYRIEAEGSGELLNLLSRSVTTEPAGTALPVLCQDRLDYHAALEFQRNCRNRGSAWLWASTGPMSRGYVSPLFLPDAGPCLGCLLAGFRRLSPAPELYDGLIEHAEKKMPIEPVPFPAEGCGILAQLVLWKAVQAALVEPPTALYRLHVLECDTMEVSTHRVLVDPECRECQLL